MNTHRIAVIGGDGIGAEVVGEGLRVLDALASVSGFRCEVERFPWGCEYYRRHGRMMPADGLDLLANHDAIYLGAIGSPGVVPEQVALRGLVLAIRFGFDQYANVRPVRPLPGAPYPLARPEPSQIDFVVVREATEGMYVGLGGRHATDAAEVAEIASMRRAFERSDELALQTGVFSEHGCRRIMQRAFELARVRDGRRLVTSATKANAMPHGMTLWNEIFEDVAAQYPDIEAEWRNVDALAMRFVLAPDELDVVVTPNLFGDILTDLSAALLGGLGFAPAANLGDGRLPAMFEPCHGSAPDIAGKGVANPTAALLTLAMMLDELGETTAAEAVECGVREVVAGGDVRTPDMGGTASTAQMGEAVADASVRIARSS